jgi:hypothetical protein
MKAQIRGPGNAAVANAHVLASWSRNRSRPLGRYPSSRATAAATSNRLPPSPAAEPETRVSRCRPGRRQQGFIHDAWHDFR